jgi:hypothetical protein
MKEKTIRGIALSDMAELRKRPMGQQYAPN